MESYLENSDAEEDTSTNNLNPHEFYLKAKLDLNIEKFTINKDTHIAISEQIYNSFNNPNMVLLIIEDMCLGLIMTDHTANKFQYIKQALEYRNQIIKLDDRGYPLMTLYLHENIPLEDLTNFKNYPEMIGIKYYPKSATTNSENGINNVENIFGSFSRTIYGR